MIWPGNASRRTRERLDVCSIDDNPGEKDNACLLSDAPRNGLIKLTLLRQ